MDLETRRALALFRSLADHPAAINDLLTYAGHAPGRVSRESCDALAAALRRDSRRLIDNHITTDVALSYAEFARHALPQLNMTANDWERLDVERQTALQLLLTIGKRPADLMAVREKLGVRDATDGRMRVGRVTAQRFLMWAHNHSIRLTPDGLGQLAQILPDREPSLQNIGATLVDWMMCRGEPPQDYTRLAYQGHAINRRTLSMLNKASAILPEGVGFHVIKGSYLTESHKGAHPHMGGGALDLTLKELDSHLTPQAVVALRHVGFAAWARERGEGVPHIHAVAIGDSEMSPSALWQIQAYFLGRDGRIRANPDPHLPLQARIPDWARKYQVRFL